MAEAEYRSRNLLRRQGLEVVRVSSSTRAESLLALHLSKLFRSLRVDLVLDVGARIGDYGVWLRRNGYRGQIVSFEPVSESFVELSRRANADGRWQAINVALGASDSSTEINVTSQTFFSSFLVPNEYALREFQTGPTIDHTEQVQIHTLDRYLPNLLHQLNAQRVYLKMDTQGWDLEVLRGARESMNHVVAMQSEVSVQPIYSEMASFEESLAAFQGLGFDVSGLFPVNLDSRCRVVEFDCVLVRGEPPANPAT